MDSPPAAASLTGTSRAGRRLAQARSDLAWRLASLGVLLLAALLRFYELAGQSLWADEGNSAALTGYSLAEIARRAALDIHPPFYYWLLKGWVTLFGASEAGLRSLSAVLGVGLVGLVGLLGWRLFNRRTGLLAAWLAALSPLQVYYAQEARMYMLLALLGGLTVLAALLLLEHAGEDRFGWPAGLLYTLAVTAGLYTHYAYPLLLVAVNLAALAWLWGNSSTRPLGTGVAHWLAWQCLPLLAYLPWLPIAWRQVTTWPAERQAVSLAATLETVATTLLWGLSWPYPPGFIPVLGLGLLLLATAGLAISHPATTHALLFLWLWFLLPVLLTVVIFTPAFLKFLLAAAPPLVLLLAVVLDRLAGLRAGGQRGPGYAAAGLLLLLVSAGAAISLYHYYDDPAYARDNYRGIAGYIRAVAGPADAVILHAEGQQDVFNYYYPAGSAPVYPLPRRRPLDEAATRAELERISQQSRRVYVVYWAAHQADPAGLIETWLDTHLYKATDQWYGNVRLASYASPAAGGLALLPAGDRLGPHIRLAGYALASRQVAPGDILELALAWETGAPEENYTVFVQVLDRANHLVGQRDARPLIPVPEWPVGRQVADRHGVLIEPGTPPGRHRVIAGLYNSATGQRLPVYPPGTAEDNPQAPARDFIDLGEVEVVRSETPLPVEAFQMQVRLDAPMLDVTLLGYDLYKAGYRSAPATPLRPGDPLHLVAYWQPQGPVRRLDDELSLQAVTDQGKITPVAMTSPPAGIDYPVGVWPPGEIVRAQYDLFLQGLAPGTYRLALTLGVKEAGLTPPTVVTGPFRVE